MNFNNLPAQLIAIFLGWTFTLFIQRRANFRAEAIRKKDKLIDRIDKLVDWTSSVCSEPPEPITEEIYTAYVTQIEMRIQNLDSLLREHAVGTELIAKLRDIDVLGKSESDPAIQIRLAAFDLIEALEIACHSRYFTEKPVWQIACYYPFFYAVTVVSISLLSVFTLAKMIIKATL